MSRKVKRLAKVIEARERVRDRCAAEMALSERMEEEARAARSELMRREEALVAAMRAFAGAPVRASVLLELDRERRLWSASVARAAERIAEQAAETERRRAILQEAAKSLRVSERVHEVVSTREAREHDRREQKIADDLVAARRPR